MRYHLILIKKSTSNESGEIVDKREPSSTVDGNALINWYSHYGEQYEGSLKNVIQNYLLHDPAIPLLSIYPEKTIIQKDSCTPMFTAEIFTIAMNAT